MSGSRNTALFAAALALATSGIAYDHVTHGVAKPQPTASTGTRPIQAAPCAVGAAPVAPCAAAAPALAPPPPPPAPSPDEGTTLAPPPPPPAQLPSGQDEAPDLQAPVRQ